MKKVETKLKPIRPSAAVTAAYRKRLLVVVDAMARSVEHWITAAYRAHPPEIAADAWPQPIVAEKAGDRWVARVDGDVLRNKAGLPRRFASEAAAIRAAKVELGVYLPADELAAAMDDLAATWQTRFDTLADDMADFFATKVADRSDTAMAAALKKSGFAVEFQPTPAMRDIMAATVQQNVGLIKSIPQKYLGNVQGAVMRSVQAGRDLGSLSKYLVEQRGVTKRRAAFIALDQNNKATGAMNDARRLELGLEQAIWRHSRAGKKPRPKHVAANGTRYNIREGLPIGDDGQNVRPGEEPGCRCISIAIIPGFAVAKPLYDPKWSPRETGRF